METEELKILKHQIKTLYEKHHSLQRYNAGVQQDQPSRSPRIAVEDVDISFIKDFPGITGFIQDSHTFKMMLKTQRFSGGKGWTHLLQI